jgi:hypothetical protein
MHRDFAAGEFAADEKALALADREFLREGAPTPLVIAPLIRSRVGTASVGGATADCGGTVLESAIFPGPDAG